MSDIDLLAFLQGFWHQGARSLLRDSLATPSEEGFYHGHTGPEKFDWPFGKYELDGVVVEINEDLICDVRLQAHYSGGKLLELMDDLIRWERVAIAYRYSITGSTGWTKKVLAEAEKIANTRAEVDALDLACRLLAVIEG